MIDYIVKTTTRLTSLTAFTDSVGLGLSSIDVSGVIDLSNSISSSNTLQVSPNFDSSASLSVMGSFLEKFILGPDDIPTLPLTESDKVFEGSVLVLYIVAYIQRHLWALRTGSTVGVQWDRGLFDDSLTK